MIKTFKQMRDVLIKKGFIKSSKDTITGDNYDKWTKEKFIKEVGKCELDENNNGENM